MATPPILTPEQRSAALAKAAEARTARAEIKVKLKQGRGVWGVDLKIVDADGKATKTGNAYP